MRTKITQSIFIATLSMLGLSNNVSAQSSVLEKTYDVSGKAKRGFLGGVEVDKEKGNINMYYVLSSFFESAGNPHSGFLGSGMGAPMPCEVYSYDKDLNSTSNFKLDVTPGTHSWANYKGLYTFETVRGFTDLRGPSFQKVEMEYLYEPKTGEYGINRVKVIDREKPKSTNGSKYTLMGGSVFYDIAAQGNTLMVCGKKVEKSEATKKNYLHVFNQMMKYDVVHCDRAMNIAVTDSFSFEYANTLTYNAQLKDQRPQSNDELARDWVLIYTAGYQSKAGFLYQAPNPTTFTYIRISPAGKIIEKILFDSPANGWKIEGIYEHDNAVYVYGSAILKDRETKNSADIKMGKAPMTHYQIAKISKGKFDFIKAYALEEMQAKMQKPSNQKKMLELTGENETSTGIIIPGSSDIYISYQNYDKKGLFKSMFLFQFDASGNNKKNFGIELAEPENEEALSSKPAKNYFYPSVDGKSLYWFLSYPKNAICQGTACSPLMGVDYASINIATGELSEMKALNNEKKNKFYLFGTTKPLQWSNFVYLFSEDENKKGRGGDNLHLTRIDISK